MSDRLKIAIVTDAIGPFHHGGKEMRYYELAQRLAVRADVTVYTMDWWRGGGRHREGAVTYEAIAPLLSLYSGGRRSIRQAVVFAICCLRLLTKDFDVIEADHMPYIQLFPLRLVALLRRRRLVVTWHECWGADYWRSYLGRPGQVGWWCEKLSLRLPHTIIAASPETGRRLSALTAGSVDVVIAPNGIDLAAIDLSAPASDAVDVVVVGRLLAHKRVDLLVEALAILHDEGLPLTASIVGIGPEHGALQTLVDARGLAEHVSFRQDIDTASQLYSVLKSARVAAFPSEREGFGIAVLEAIACGVPVVTTSATDNLARHLVEQSDKAGIVCEPTANGLAAAIRLMLARSDSPARDVDSWLFDYDWPEITNVVYAALV